MANKSQSIYQINNTAVKTHENVQERRFFSLQKQGQVSFSKGFSNEFEQHGMRYPH